VSHFIRFIVQLMRLNLQPNYLSKSLKVHDDQMTVSFHIRSYKIRLLATKSQMYLLIVALAKFYILYVPFQIRESTANILSRIWQTVNKVGKDRLHLLGEPTELIFWFFLKRQSPQFEAASRIVLFFLKKNITTARRPLRGLSCSF
jgi:hypothetical protein